MRWNRVPYFEFTAKSSKIETTWLEFPNGGKAIVKQILALEEVNKSKRTRRPQIFIKPSFWEMCGSTLSGSHPFGYMAIICWVKNMLKTKR